MKKNLFIPLGALMLTSPFTFAQTEQLVPLKERVNVQADSAKIKQIIDGQWVAVGTNKPHAIQLDYSRL